MCVSAPPTNDKYSARKAVTGSSGSIVADTRWTTAETGERNFEADFGLYRDESEVYPDAASLWFKYTAPAGAPRVVTFAVSTDDGNLPFIAVFTDAASQALLRPVMMSTDGGVSLALTAGSKVTILVDGSRSLSFLEWSSTRTWQIA
jgi:hypothetical protein